MTSSTRQPDLTTKAQSYLEQAYAHEETGELEQALQQCELALQIIPDLAEAHNLRGIILEQLGQGEQALVAYRAAIRINPDFEEAKQNLREAEDETSQLQHATHQRRTRKAVLWGMLGFGISFLLVETIFTIAQVQGLFQRISKVNVGSTAVEMSDPLVLNFYIKLPGFYLRVNGIYIENICGALFYAIGSGVGVASIGLAIKSKKIGLLAAAGGLGYGLAYALTAIADLSLLFNLFLDLGFSWYSASTATTIARLALIGACTGAFLGAVQKSWAQAGLLALAGAIGFGSYGVFQDIIFDWARDNNFPFSLKKDLSFDAMLIIVSGIRGALVGFTSGALLGFALGQKEPASQPAEAVNW